MDVEAVQLTVGSFIERGTDVAEADHSSGDEAAEHLIVRVPPVGPMVVDQFATPTIGACRFEARIIEEPARHHVRVGHAPRRDVCLGDRIGVIGHSGPDLEVHQVSVTRHRRRHAVSLLGRPLSGL